jgi:peptidoglycan/LPS O-acetylase OafA/YrhL
LVYLDGLRGFAALMVVLFHFWGGAGYPSWFVHLTPNVTVDLMSPVGALGGSRVSLFFVLSGFLLYLPFARRDADESDGGSESRNRNQHPPERETLVAWLWRRLRRLAPPYYVAILLALLPNVGTFYLNEGWRTWVRHLPPRVPEFAPKQFDAFPECLFFMHGMVPGSEFPIFNGPLWTLTPEVQLYLTFPLLVALARWRGVRIGARWRVNGLGLAVAVAVGASVAYRVWLYEQIGFALRLAEAGTLGSEYHCLVNTFLGRWAEFALGMGAAGIVVRERIQPSRLSPLLLLPAFGLCLAWFLVLRSDIAVGGWVGHLFLAMEPAPSPMADGVGGAAFALLILCCAAVPRVARVFSWQPLTALGTIAYSLYLIHSPILFWLYRAIHVLFHTDINTSGQGSLAVLALNMMVGLPIALFAAYLFWLVFERPFLSRERRTTLNNPTTALNGSLTKMDEQRPIPMAGLRREESTL